jgi:hypothetical protein
MFCTKCGAAILGNAKFCTGCGNQVVPPSPGGTSTPPLTSQSSSPGASVPAVLSGAPSSQWSKSFKISLVCVLGAPLWLLALFATLAGNTFSVKMWGIGFLLGLSGIIYFLVRSIRNSSAPVTATAAVPKAHVSSWKLIQSIGGIAIAGFVLWRLNSGSSLTGIGVATPDVMNCGEPIVIEACESDTFPSCRIRNLAQVPLGRIAAWGYDAQGVRIGSPMGVGTTDGLGPQAVVNAQIVVENIQKVRSIVLCGVDPQSTLGSRRFGVGQRPPL